MIVVFAALLACPSPRPSVETLAPEVPPVSTPVAHVPKLLGLITMGDRCAAVRYVPTDTPGCPGRGEAWHSADAGETWRLTLVADAVSMGHLVASGDTVYLLGHRYCAGSTPQLWESTDAGAIWTEVLLPEALAPMTEPVVVLDGIGAKKGAPCLQGEGRWMCRVGDAADAPWEAAKPTTLPSPAETPCRLRDGVVEYLTESRWVPAKFL